TFRVFALNYAGVILAPPVPYARAPARIETAPPRYEARAAFPGREGGETPPAVMARIILNSINVLMTRGVRGLYLYASDPRLHARLDALWNARQAAPAARQAFSPSRQGA
ncbi:DNA/RNA helicase domain-containing protein, partial [Novacetimonas pomaceti]|uniref:DNA/RNA helicase domain-containing protein n=1 Tax=Novacetimonas pomaceti TaxID=2021998 RepID=UPI001C2DA648